MRRTGVVVGIALAVAALPASASAVPPLGDTVRASQTGSDGDADRNAINAAVAFDPSDDRFLVVWRSDASTDEEQEIYGQLLAADGSPIGSDIRLTHVGTDGDVARDAGSPSVDYDAALDRFVLVYAADDEPTDDAVEIWSRVLNTDGTPQTAPLRLSTTPDTFGSVDVAVPDVACSAEGGCLVAWEADNAADGEREIFFRRLSGGVAADIQRRLTFTGTDGVTTVDARRPAVAAGADGWLVSFDAPVSGATNIQSRRITAAGTIVDVPAATLSSAAAGRASFASDAAWSPSRSEYVVVWNGDQGATDEDVETWAQRVGADGTPVGDDIPVSAVGPAGDPFFGARFPGIAVDRGNGEVLIPFGANLTADAHSETFAQRLTADGAEREPEFRVSVTGQDADPLDNATQPVAAAGQAGTGYLVAWQATGAVADNKTEIFVRRVLPDPPVVAPPPPGGGSTTPPVTTPADTTAPGLSVSRAASQRVPRIRLRATCSEACSLTAANRLRGARGTVRAVRRSLRAGVRTTVTITLSKRVTASVRRALRRGRRVSLRVTVTVRDAANNRRTRTITVRLKR